ncbi:alpha-(1,3)-fucosyltransferase 4 [Suncus etruscus]|uniref:alpha-(1,3)-fucosyltransferase 4 n=1 Tax=Suncus etruscus TaxID=109475 RepID=UPI002110D8C5|nr:alpha-(1,3)-fucosyltransferase 4 [Suncus etruscus]
MAVRAHGRAGRRGWRPRCAWVLALGLLACAWELLAPPLPWGARSPPPPPVKVLLWWEPFQNRSVSRPPPDCEARFSIRGCHLLADRARLPEADAVLLHHRDLVRAPPEQCPPAGPARPRGQLWVWMNLESPTHTPLLGRLARFGLNWTLTYRADSDVFVPYGRLRPRVHAWDPPVGPAPPPGSKRALVAWVVSHWDERHARVRYYRQLRRHLAVDVFGLAGGHGRPLPAWALPATLARYEFYLAFENSQHRDYITEKLWRNALLAGAVPVVLGPPRANYERFVPRRAFLHVDDFPSAARLAAHLRLLHRRPAAYRRHFLWRRSFAVRTITLRDGAWCLACQAVQRARAVPGHRRPDRDIARWFRS